MEFQALAQRGGNIAAVDGGDIAGRFQLQCLMQEGLRHIMGGDLAAKQVIGEVVVRADAARARALGDESIVDQTGTNWSALTALARSRRRIQARIDAPETEWSPSGARRVRNSFRD